MTSRRLIMRAEGSAVETFQNADPSFAKFIRERLNFFARDDKGQGTFLKGNVL
ncbi:MAG TPA: hypothetical protein VH596_00070 [Terriglobales bacterium]